MEDILTVFKASQICNVSPKTIINWIESGHIPAYKTVGGHRRIKKDDLEAFMRKQGIPIPDTEPEDVKKRILVVDDDPIIVETIVQALEEDAFDYEVISASDGFEAGLQVNHFKPHLLILDIMMPDIKGYEVCRKIKTGEETKDTKIIVLSAYLDEEKFAKMKEYGADVCFSKPLPLAQLKGEAARLLGLEE
ncbi:Protein with response regulator receiver domain [Desulfatibacillum aliphaticivorans]|uniref:Protein with response regulator receiver domain n=1 Tax=Desulfatibacillum aliphaticivorans TaxID=218208 RepID=B8FFI8_DESAL|nr:response regulator [Desulfatibacillum aliphaticivorans]ACL04248.1 Protein with response regulator receiver domain [Desulfatibacillum aliphaticivorans]